MTVTINPADENGVGIGNFLDRNGNTHDFIYRINGTKALGIYVDNDQSYGFFESLPPPHSNTWFATGVKAVPQGKGIGSCIYAIARDCLKQLNGSIAPSDKVSPDAMKLWTKLDPTAAFEPRGDGHFRPK